MDLATRIAEDPRTLLRNSRGVDPDGRSVVYWMQRAQRAIDNPALESAVRLANELSKPLAVFFGLVKRFPGANERHYAFMLDGLNETAGAIERLGARFVLGVEPDHDLAKFCSKLRPAAVIGDENPLRVPELWRKKYARSLRCAFATVDADVIVPTQFFPKEEFAARTLRPKITKSLHNFLVKPRRIRLKKKWPRSLNPRSAHLGPEKLLAEISPNRAAARVRGVAAGTSAARRQLRHFVRRRLGHYDARRNKPEFADGTSLLSPYLHFGQIGPREVAMAVRDSGAPKASVDAFLEEFVVRRELCVNYVARNPRYDSFAGLHEWARKTLRTHARDKREHLYCRRQLESCATHDPLWNAAQKEMILSGRTHGYVRMYWAKKILEWSRSPEEALATAIALNDKWFLDGRDPNGYANIAWAMGGKHDRPWPERRIFGKIRYMSYASTSRKFDCAGYIRRTEELERR